MFAHKFDERLVGIAANVQDYLLVGIDIAHELHARLGVYRGVNVHLDDVAEDAEVRVEVFRLNLRDVERAFALRQAGHVGVEDVEQGATGRCVPSLFVEHDKVFCDKIATKVIEL